MNRAKLLEKFADGVPDWIIEKLAEHRPLKTLVHTTVMPGYDGAPDEVAIGTTGTHVGHFARAQGGK